MTDKDAAEALAEELAAWQADYRKNGTDPAGLDIIARHLTAAHERGRTKGLEEAEGALESERLVDDTGHPVDLGYNSAIGDCLVAIRSLKDRKEAKDG